MSLQIRRTIYRNTHGFLICGKDPGGRSIGIFMRYRDLAERMRECLKSDDDAEKVAIWREYAERKKRLTP